MADRQASQPVTNNSVTMCTVIRNNLKQNTVRIVLKLNIQCFDRLMTLLINVFWT